MYYRKYRPQTISELDNVRIKETLGRALLEDNWASAYLLIGTRGSGKTTTARIIAKIVNCTNRKKGEEPCNKCESCKAITNGSSLDVIEIDAASHTGVEDIRDLRDKIKLAPSGSKFKVYIIDEVHMLSTSAFNALLKTLEEPPAHVIFILATTDMAKVPETIKSRCLVFDFGRARQEEILAGIGRIAKKEKLEIAKEILEKIAQKASGSHRDAAKILEQLVTSSAKPDMARLDALETQSSERAALDLLRFLFSKDHEAALKLISGYVEKEGNISELMVFALRFLRDFLVTPEKAEDLEIQEKFSQEEFRKLIYALIEAEKLLRDCPIPSLPLELLTVQWCQIEQPSASKFPQNSETESVKAENLKIVSNKITSVPADSQVAERWPEIVLATKAHNHSLMALLKASRPGELSGDRLTIEVFYKFHKEKLEEKKNRDMLEEVISDIIKTPIKVKFELTEKG